MASKFKSEYVCSDCGSVHKKWAGKCPDCNAWNTLIEQAATDTAKSNNRMSSSWTGVRAGVIDYNSISASSESRITMDSPEFERALGGGLVKGSITLLGGDPGIGKSTLMLQVIDKVVNDANLKVLYVAGEESPSQISLRGQRLNISFKSGGLSLLPEIDLNKILAEVEKESPDILIVDSIQTIYSPELQSAPGSVAQVRECAAHLTTVAKSKGVTVILIGHVTKEGQIAGPRVLEHMVDTLMFFEGDPESNFRMLRCLKNRFGPVNELGIYMMTEDGLEEVSNPSGLFLSPHEDPVSGSAIFCAQEGNRPFLVEIQALVEETSNPNPRRYASGIDLNKILMNVAVLSKHSGIEGASELNIYVKVVGGIKITDPASDLSVLIAIASSLKNKRVPKDLVAIGEVGLAGEIRSVRGIEARVKEAVTMGFKSVIIPSSSKLKGDYPDVTIKRVSKISDVATIIKSFDK